MDSDDSTTASDPPADPELQPGNDDLAVVILTAGRGTRMRSALPKVLHPIAGLPMIEHVIRAAEGIAPRQIILTLGPTSADLRERYQERVHFAWQSEPLGTGDAARVALPVLAPDIEWVMVIFGDHPLVDAATLQRLMEETRRAQPILASVAVVLDDPGPYGRYRLAAHGQIIAIVEAHEDTQTYDGPVPVNSGMCCIRRDWLAQIAPHLTLSPKGEYYLTELVARAAQTEWPRNPVLRVDAQREVAWGVNDRVELARAERIVRQRINEQHMLAGVTIVDPTATYIDVDVHIGEDTRIEPGTTLRGASIVGRRCHLGPDAVIEDSHLADDVTVRASWIESSDIGAEVDIGPYSHLRPGVRIAEHVHIGNYVEMKNTAIGHGTAVGHVSYLGDAIVGNNVNIGAGTITANYDGTTKHTTTIEDGVFVSCDTILRAPVRLGKGSKTGAGAVVLQDVAPGATVIGIPARVLRTTHDE